MQSLVLPLVRKYNIGGKRFQRFVMEHLTAGSYRKIVDVVDIIHHTALEIYDSGKRSFEATGEGSSKKDILSILGESKFCARIYARMHTFLAVRENAKTKAENKMSDEEVIAQIR